VKSVFHINHNLADPASATFKITAGNIAFSWAFALGILGVFLLLLAVYHKFIMPHPAEVKTAEHISLKTYGEVLVSFFRKPGIIPAILFFFLYRLGEAQSIKVATPFLADSRAAGGIGMSAAQYGIAYGTIGMIAIVVGGILGGLSAAKFGLKKLIWLMALSMNLPNLGLLYISITQPLPGDLSVYLAIILEQFGYGFGFTAYMLYMLYFVGESKFKTAEYAIGTSIMALGLMLPGMLSGYMQEWLGYQGFFIYVMFCTIPGMLIIPFLKIRADFGIRQNNP
jgi:PAT family beta-lactamase induction signal transducer AmpG